MDFRVTFKNQKNQVNFVISFPSVFNRYAVAAFLQKSPDNVHHARKIPTQKKALTSLKKGRCLFKDGGGLTCSHFLGLKSR